MSVREVSGVYVIVNTVEWKIYIGSSKGVYGRWADHKRLWYRGRHHPRLQKAFDTYGEASFEFYLLEEISDETLLRKVEEKWIQRNPVL